jgi:hypothetical protein
VKVVLLKKQKKCLEDNFSEKKKKSLRPTALTAKIFTFIKDKRFNYKTLRAGLLLI